MLVQETNGRPTIQLLYLQSIHTHTHIHTRTRFRRIFPKLSSSRSPPQPHTPSAPTIPSLLYYFSHNLESSFFVGSNQVSLLSLLHYFQQHKNTQIKLLFSPQIFTHSFSLSSSLSTQFVPSVFFLFSFFFFLYFFVSSFF